MESLVCIHLLAVHMEALAHPAAMGRLAREASAPTGRRWMVLGCRWLCGLGRFVARLGEQLHRAGLGLAGAIEKRVMAEQGRGSSGRRAAWRTMENG